MAKRARTSFCVRGVRKEEEAVLPLLVLLLRVGSVGGEMVEDDVPAERWAWRRP